MEPTSWSVKYKGVWTTISTCGGPAGAFCSISHKKVSSVKELPSAGVYRRVRVNRCLVLEVK